MITDLQINNFKCFQNSPSFKFSKVNLLTGINGRGKSTLLQSLLVISQSIRNTTLEKLKLNGRNIQLGSYQDIKNSEMTRGESISFNIKMVEPTVNAVISFIENETDSLTGLLEKLDIELSDIAGFENINKKIEDFKNSIVEEESININTNLRQAVFCNLLSKIHYVSADRVGPVKYVEKTSLTGFLNVGPCGERAINILANDNLPLVYDELYRGKDSKTVLQQTQEWLNYILEGAKVTLKGKDAESSVLYILLNNKNNSHRYKPSNVGFGYSYVLPLIVSGLIARSGEVLIVENPEAHLHPRAQSKITEFFSAVASCGVQVFIESHSEHILNGLRVSALNPNINIDYKDLTIQYFNEDFQCENLIMDEKGKIENWPKGFFDQQELDLANVFKLGQ